MMKKVVFVMLMVLSASIAVAVGRTPPPEIVVYEGDEYVVWAFGEGEVHLFKDSEEVENPYIIEMTDEEQHFYFEAYAQEEGCLPSEMVGEDVYVPALQTPILPVLPNFDLIVTDEYAYIEFSMLGDYTVSGVYVNGVILDSPYVLPRWEEDYIVRIDVEFSHEGMNPISHGQEFIVPALEGAPHDVDGDGNISINDVTALIQYLLTLNPEGVNVEKTDVDGSGNININDVIVLIERLLNIPW